MGLELYNLGPARIAAEARREAWPRRTLTELLAERAVRWPERVACEDGVRALTYGALLGQACALAAGLRGRGVRPGDVVAFQLPTALETVLLHYAIVFAG